MHEKELIVERYLDIISRMKKLILTAVFVFSVISLMLSCTKDDRENNMLQQETSIESYVKTFSEQRVQVYDKVWRVVMVEGTESVEAQKGDSVFFDYAAYIFNSGKGFLFSTNKRSIAEDAKMTQDVSLFNKWKVRLGNGELISGLDEGLEGVKRGERCYVVFSSRKGFGSVQIGLVPKMSPLIYEVWITDVKKN
ncbi:MAG: hypothetical protein CVU12_05010 [Bacteroidetes bacterium HGW-Bacteroidetes-7]|jgi:hypothetical protein|nr:MAG: hypothetical protein CVU12_05010 [Bacteroidetes bacterium HGW-Bacteroidetes-7]